MEWLTDADHHHRIVSALARAFDLLDLPRYTGLCRSPTTTEVLDAYERSDAEGNKAFHKADVASGIRPPDIDELEWGPVMGMQEAGAQSDTADLLELAVASSELVPGSRGWKQRQHELVRTHLTASRIDLGGRTLLDAIRDASRQPVGPVSPHEVPERIGHAHEVRQQAGMRQRDVDLGVGGQGVGGPFEEDQGWTSPVHRRGVPQPFDSRVRLVDGARPGLRPGARARRDRLAPTSSRRPVAGQVEQTDRPLEPEGGQAPVGG